MNQQTTTRKIFFFLSGTVFVLALIYFSTRPKHELSRLEQKIANKITPEEARDSMSSVFREFGLEDSLCRPMKKRDLQKYDAQAGYQVTLPIDVPVPLLIREMEKKFYTKGAFITSVEKKNGLDFETTVSDSSTWKLIFHFTNDEKLKRPNLQIARLIKMPKDASEDDIAACLTGIENEALLLPLTKIAAKSTMRIHNAGCDYIIDLSDVSDEQAFKLDASFTKKRLDESFEEIFKNFPGSRAAYIRGNSAVHNSTAWPYIKAKLQKKKVAIFTDADVLYLQPASGMQAVNTVIGDARKAGKSIVLCAFADRNSMQELFDRAGLLGAVPVTVDSVLQRR